MVRKILSVAGVAFALLIATPALGAKPGPPPAGGGWPGNSGPGGGPQPVPEFDVAAIGSIVAIIAGGAVLLGGRRRR